MAPVILQMDVHCLRCARRIRKALRSLHGVDDLWVSVDTGLVVVAGASLDAAALQWRIQARTGRPVAVVSDGTQSEDPPPENSGQMVYMGPPPPPPPPAYPSYSYPYAAGWAPPAHHDALQQYVPGGTALPYAPPGGLRHYNDAPPCCRDGSNPSGCCTMQ